VHTRRNTAHLVVVHVCRPRQVDEGFKAVRTDLAALSAKLDQGLAKLSQEAATGNAQALEGLTELRTAASEVKKDVSALRARREPPTAEELSVMVNLSLRPLAQAVQELQGSTSSALEAVAKDLEQTRVTLLHEVSVRHPARFSSLRPKNTPHA
jgi:hypothetical protein